VGGGGVYPCKTLSEEGGGKKGNEEGTGGEKWISGKSSLY